MDQAEALRLAKHVLAATQACRDTALAVIALNEHNDDGWATDAMTKLAQIINQVARQATYDASTVASLLEPDVPF